MTGAPAKALLNAVHGRVVLDRRVEVLANALARTIPPGPAAILDLGCGDGQVAYRLMQGRGELSVSGVDVLRRPHTHIPVTLYDGITLPFADESFDYVTIVDVLHHTDEPAAILAEAARVVRKGVVIKDHLREGLLAGPTLRLMDWVGNRGHDVRLPYNYLDRAQWQDCLAQAQLTQRSWSETLGLYPAPLSWLFERKLHFIGLFGKASNSEPVR